MTPSSPSARPSRTGAALFALGALVALAALVAIVFSGLGARWGWWDFRAGFTILRWASYGALAGAAVAMLGAVVRGPRRRRRVVLAGMLGLVAIVIVAVPWNWRRTARAVPPIHDITTDLDNPPPFVALYDRPGARNPVEYGGPEIARQQREGYPDLGPLMLPVAPAVATRRAAEVADDLGWEIAAVDTVAGRVEATDRTRWFGFYDDVVVRVTPDGAGSRVDVRSLSRVGGSDVGTNARRIRTFLSRLREGDA